MAKQMNSKAKKAIMITSISLASIIAALILTVVIYIIYMSAQFYRIEDNLKVDIENNQAKELELQKEYDIMTYNIGFGAYSQDFSFFMDSGEMKDGKKVTGKDSRAKNKDEVLKNTNGAIAEIKKYSPDFVLWQEVDTKATRSYKVNQYTMLDDLGNNYAKTFASNFHSGYLFYPIFNPHGSVDAGITTMSTIKMKESTRRSFPIDMGFINKFVDLDRCFMLTRFTAPNNKELVVINLHMSAYDKGGVYRKQQLDLLNSVLADEYEKGNYVVAGGDFNHDIANSVDVFPSEQKKPEWVYTLTNDNLPENFAFADAKNNAPTCRSSDIAYKKGVNRTVVIDGFIFSSNIEVVSATNIDNDFMYSDHQPAKMTFKLKA